MLTYDQALHHIGLGDPTVSAQPKGFLIAGAWTRAFRRQVQSEFDGVQYGGGDSLVNKPGLSSWTQDDFSGGAYQYVWGKDQSQFARSSNALPSQFDRSLRSVPMLQQWLNGKRLTTTVNPLVVFVYNGFLYAFIVGPGPGFTQTLHRWDLATGAASSQSLTTGFNCRAACFDRQEGVLWADQDGQIGRYLVGPWGAGWTYTYTGPNSAVGNIVGISASGDRVILAYENVLWTLDVPDNRTVVDAPQDAYLRIGRLPGRWQSACWSGGLLYVLLSGLDSPTQLVAFDGTQVLPITDFPFNFVGQSLCSYGGRLFVGGSGLDIQTAAPRYAELYEVTGASVRLLKTFAPESRSSGEVLATTIPTLAVHEGLLFFGLKGLGLHCYDLTTDSFYGASVFSPTDATAEIRHLVGARDSLMAWVYPIAANSGDSGWFRPATPQETVAAYETQVDTSDFATAFDRKKRWKQLRILTRYSGSVAVAADYSVNGGQSWSIVPGGVLENSGKNQLTTFDLSTLPESRTIRFRIHLPSSTDVAGFRELVAFTVSFRLLESDAVGTGEKEKLAWTFVIVGSETAEALDGSTIEQDLSGIHESLWDWARGRKKLDYIDTDGSEYTVEIDDLRETVPFVLPPVDDPDTPGRDSTAREAFYTITLVEV